MPLGTTSLFNRYRPLGSNPGATMFSPEDFPGMSLPPSYDGAQYQADMSATPLVDSGATDTPQQYDYSTWGGGDSADAQQDIPQVDPTPSMAKKATDPAGKINYPQNELGPDEYGQQGQPSGPPTPPPSAQGAPQPPVDPEAGLGRYAALVAKPPVLGVDPVTGQKKPPNLAQKIGLAALSATRLGPETAFQIMHPNYTRQVAEYGQQKADLANQIKLADQVQDTQDKSQSHKEKDFDFGLKVDESLGKLGIVLRPKGAPVDPASGLIPTVLPPEVAARHPDQVAYVDPHAGQFQVTKDQAEAVGNTVPAGSWQPLSILSRIVDAGGQQQKPTKESTVPVSVATARAHGIQSPPNENGTIDVPIQLAAQWPETGKQEKEESITDPVLAARAQGIKTGNKIADAMTPAQAKQAIIDSKDKPSPPGGSVTNILMPGALDMAAEQYATTGQLPAVGFGKDAAAMREKIMNRAAELHPGANLAGNKQDYAANTGVLKDLERQAARVGTSEGTASRNLDIAAGNSARTDRTGSPLANKYLLYLKGQVAGDDDTQLLQNAVETAASEYANVVTAGTGGGQPATDASRNAARTMLNAAMANGTFQKVVKQMKQEMGNRSASFKEQLTSARSGRPGGGGRGGQQQMETQSVGGHTYSRRKGSSDPWTLQP